MATGAVIGVTAASTAYQIYSDRKRAKAEEAAARERGEAKRVQAFELLERFELNAEALRKRGSAFQQEQMAAFAAGGVDVTKGTPLLAMQATKLKVDQQLMIERKEAESKANALFAGADIDTRLAGDIRAAERRGRIGTFLSGAAGVARTT